MQVGQVYNVTVVLLTEQAITLSYDSKWKGKIREGTVDDNAGNLYLLKLLVEGQNIDIYVTEIDEKKQTFFASFKIIRPNLSSSNKNKFTLKPTPGGFAKLKQHIESQENEKN